MIIPNPRFAFPTPQDSSMSSAQLQVIFFIQLHSSSAAHIWMGVGSSSGIQAPTSGHTPKENDSSSLSTHQLPITLQLEVGIS